MLKLYSLNWEVDGCSGTTLVRATGVDMVRAHFNRSFKPHGYTLVAIRLSY